LGLSAGSVPAESLFSITGLSRTLSHVNLSSSVDRNQLANRQGYLTETALLKVTNDEAIDSRQSVIPVALDQSAAFDCIDHEVCLSRLEHTFGLTGAALAWVKSYFSSRTAFVKFGPNTSDTATISTGIPQGSTLGPVQFPSYISPLSEMIESFGVHHHQYVDDTQL
jgi:hypothetical protein